MSLAQSARRAAILTLDPDSRTEPSSRCVTLSSSFTRFTALMALPWLLVTTTRFADGNVVEDMQLGIDLALAGKSPLFLPAARVDSPLPQQRAAARTQRLVRLEKGQLVEDTTHHRAAAADGIQAAPQAYKEGAPR